MDLSKARDGVKIPDPAPVLLVIFYLLKNEFPTSKIGKKIPT